jgi:hypothetical protein
MASGMKIVFMFALMATMAMAVQAGSRNVSCTNEYCYPIVVNGVVIRAGLTLEVLVDDDLQTLTCAVPDILGNLVVRQCSCPSYDSKATIMEQGMDLVLVTECAPTLPCPDIYMPPCILSTDRDPAVCFLPQPDP